MITRDFFEYGSSLVSSTIQVDIINLDELSPGNSRYRFVADKLLKGHYTDITFPVAYKHDRGRKWEDMLDTGYPPLQLISNKMKTVLEENELTGWKTYPIRIFKKRGEEIFGYHGFSVTGRSGPTRYDQATIIEKPFYKGGEVHKHYKGLYIDLHEWDKTDFFIPAVRNCILVTKKAAEALQKYKFTNVELINLADYTRDICSLKSSAEDLKNAKEKDRAVFWQKVADKIRKDEAAGLI